MNGETFLKILSDMKVDGRQLDFGLNIVIVTANALVVYSVVPRNQKTPGNQPVTKLSF